MFDFAGEYRQTCLSFLLFASFKPLLFAFLLTQTPDINTLIKSDVPSNIERKDRTSFADKLTVSLKRQSTVYRICLVLYLPLHLFRSFNIYPGTYLTLLCDYI